jgi:hypothetical protein
VTVENTAGDYPLAERLRCGRAVRALSLVVTGLFLSSLASGAVVAALDIRTMYLAAGLLLILVVATAARTSRAEATTDEQPAGPAVDDD